MKGPQGRSKAGTPSFTANGKELSCCLTLQQPVRTAGAPDESKLYPAHIFHCEKSLWRRERYCDRSQAMGLMLQSNGACADAGRSMINAGDDHTIRQQEAQSLRTLREERHKSYIVWL
jgi:hypothetical protein